MKKSNITLGFGVIAVSVILSFSIPHFSKDNQYGEIFNGKSSPNALIENFKTATRTNDANGKRGVFFPRDLISHLLAEEGANGLFVYYGYETDAARLKKYPLHIIAGTGDPDLFSSVWAFQSSSFLSRAYVRHFDDATNPDANALVAAFIRERYAINDGVFFPATTIKLILGADDSEYTGLTFYYAIEGTDYPLIMTGSKAACSTENQCDIDVDSKVSRGYCPVMCGHSLD